MTTENDNTPAEAPEAPVTPEGTVTPVTPEGSEAPEGTPGEGGAEAPEETPEGGEEVTPKVGEIRYTGEVTKRIGKLTRDKHEAQREAAYWKGKAEAGHPVPAPEVAPQAPSVDPEPQEEDYESQGEFVKALGSWQYKKDKKADSVRSASTAQADAATKMRTDFDRDVDSSDIRERYPDFDEVIEDSGGVFIGEVMEELVLTSENSVDIVNHLARNLDEVEKIGNMTPVQAAKAIARLEVKLTTKPVKKKNISNAPVPINPVNGNDAGIKKDVAEMSYKEYKDGRDRGDIK